MTLKKSSSNIEPKDGKLRILKESVPSNQNKLSFSNQLESIVTSMSQNAMVNMIYHNSTATNEAVKISEAL